MIKAAIFDLDGTLLNTLEDGLTECLTNRLMNMNNLRSNHSCAVLISHLKNMFQHVLF